jgi:hypothetical protein
MEFETACQAIQAAAHFITAAACLYVIAWLISHGD